MSKREKIEKSEEFKKFEKSYTGIIDPVVAFAEAKARIDVQNGMFKNATYSEALNRKLEKEHISNARRSVGAKY